MISLSVFLELIPTSGQNFMWIAALEMCLIKNVLKCSSVSSTVYIYIYIRGVNVNTLTHVINLKILTR